MKRISFLARIVPSLLLVGCGVQSQDSGTTTGGKTNWFSRCSETADCAELEGSICAERVCTRACEWDGMCAELEDNAYCAEENGRPSGICLPESTSPKKDDGDEDAGAAGRDGSGGRGGVGGTSASGGATSSAGNGNAGEDGGGGTSGTTGGTGGNGGALSGAAGMVTASSEFDETAALFRGTLTLECEDDAESHGILSRERSVQLLVSRSGVELAGSIWGLPAAGPAELRGEINDDRVAFASFDLVWGGFNDWMERFDMVDPVLTAERLSAQVTGTLHGTGGGDIIYTCEASGELVLERDTTPPLSGVTPENEVYALTPLLISFDEPVLSSLSLSVYSNGRPLDVSILAPIEARLPQFIDIVPKEAWPSGDLTIEVRNAEDKGGNTLPSTTWTLEVPTIASATENPSFEAVADSTAPWLGCYIDASLEYYDFTLGQNVEVLPSDGERLAICRDIGLAMQAYVEPPDGATRLLLDAGVFGSPESEEPLVLSLTCGQESRELRATASIDSEVPVFQTYAVTLEPGAENCWLQLRHYGDTDELGSALGGAFVDNLRFE